jgi:hypothetical protein
MLKKPVIFSGCRLFVILWKTNAMQELKKPDNLDVDYDGSYHKYYLACGEPLLEYVAIIANLYYPYRLLDLADLADSAHNDIFSNAIVTFAYRYFNNRINKSFEKKFIENKELQETITALGYDVDKFWYLLLFVYDSSCDTCDNGILFNESPREQMIKFTDAILNNVEHCDQDNNRINEVTFKSPTKIELIINGKRTMTIDDPKTIYEFTEICRNKMDEMEMFSVIDHCEIANNFNDEGNTEEKEPGSIHLSYVARMFLNFFKLKPPKKIRKKKSSTISYNRKLLISKLIYIVGLSMNKNLLFSDDTLKGYLEKYKNYELKNSLSPIYGRL